MDPETWRTVVGLIGNIISFYIFLTPLPTLLSIWKEKSVQEYKPDPYIATALNCAMWVLYGTVHPDSLLVATINTIGFFIEAIYVTIFFVYSDSPKCRKILIAVLVELVFFIVVMIITLWFLQTTESRSMLIGMLCIVFNIVMYTSPLTIMSRVIKNKSVKCMPFHLSLANFANGLVWSTYALIKFDPYVLVPNCLGGLFGLVQMVLYAQFYKTTNWDVDEPVHKETEHSGASAV